MNFSAPKVSGAFFIGAYRKGRWQGGFQQRFFRAEEKQERQCAKLCVTLVNVNHLHELSLKRLILHKFYGDCLADCPGRTIRIPGRHIHRDATFFIDFQNKCRLIIFEFHIQYFHLRFI